jgi:glycerophosphoryl diester phosphodiesterase
MLCRMMILAHRGCSGRTCTENTLEAFAVALAQGADGVELDLRVSRDGELMVVHDTNLHRIAGDAHKISELTANELAAVPLRYGGTIPTLNDVTASVHAPAILDIEVKLKDVVEVLIGKLKTSATLRERTVISSFNAAVLDRVRKEVPDVRTLLLVIRWPLPLRRSVFERRLRQLAPWGVAFSISTLNRRRVAYLRGLGLHVGGWDRRRPKQEARKACALGLDVAILRNIQEGRGRV